MSAKREKRLRKLERRVENMEMRTKAIDAEINYWRKRAFKAEFQQEGRPKGLLVKIRRFLGGIT